MIMNPFRVTADLLHLMSFFVLIFKIKSSKSCTSLSCKSQTLLLVVFCARYLDLFLDSRYQTSYLVAMKILFVSMTAYTIYLMKFKKPYSESYDVSVDNFRYWLFLIPGAFVAALFIHRYWTVIDFLWSFSIWLEAVAILPQLHLLNQIHEVDNLTIHYVALLGFYRIFYIFNWISRYSTEGSVCWTSVFGGLAQTAMLGNFLFNYFKNANYSNCVLGSGAQANDPKVEIEIGSSDSEKNVKANSILATQYNSLQD